MSQEINLGGTIYISSRRGAEITGYSQDYVGQLARSGSIDARRVSGLWYVLESSLVAYKEKAEQFIPTPPQKVREIEREISVSFEGKDYISASRASEISGYNADYVTQLAREGKILAHQSAGRWFVDRESLLAHKEEKDSLLAEVQSQAVGIRDIDEIKVNIVNENKISTAHFTYVHEKTAELIPLDEKKVEKVTVMKDRPRELEKITDEGTTIPIRILEEHTGVEKLSGISRAVPRRFFSLLALFLVFIGLAVAGLVWLAPYGYSPMVNAIKKKVSVPNFLEGIAAREIIFVRENDF